MNLNLTSRLHSSLARIMTDTENEAYYNETHQTSEPLFWLVFGVAIIIALIAVYVAWPIQRWLARS